MSKHTPGPWAFIEGNRERGGTSIIHKSTDGAFIVAHVVCECRNDEQRAEDIANARLIAAAPELLEACKALWDRLDANARCGNPPSHEDKLAMNLGLAALSKATQ